MASNKKPTSGAFLSTKERQTFFAWKERADILRVLPLPPLSPSENKGNVGILFLPLFDGRKTMVFVVFVVNVGYFLCIKKE